jgi:hypothetical protein
MAIIFNKNIINEISESIFDHQELFVIVYKNSQPTLADFETNWTSKYFYDETTPTFGSDVLATYGIGNADSDLTWTQNTATSGSPIIYLDDASFTSTFVKNGTASFACIWMQYASQSFSSIFTGGDAALPTTTPYMLVPVTNVSGTGIVKLSTVTINSSAPTLNDIDIKYGGGTA